MIVFCCKLPVEYYCIILPLNSNVKFFVWLRRVIATIITKQKDSFNDLIVSIDDECNIVSISFELM